LDTSRQFVGVLVVDARLHGLVDLEDDTVPGANVMITIFGDFFANYQRFSPIFSPIS
jgi:hypothetical protein